jgi:Tol biopolymer transport system component
MRVHVFAIGALVLLSIVTVGAVQNPNDLFQRGLARERADGDIEGAIQIYERIVRDFSSNRPLVAKTLVQLGICYQKLGQSKARAYYLQVIDKFSDLADMVAEARQRLANVEAEATESLVEIKTPFTNDPFGFAISPDGRSLVYQATVDGKSQLWLRRLDTVKVDPIPGTENARQLTYPFWSPDGRSIGFFAEQKLKRVDVNGDNLKVLAAAPEPRGGSWGKTGVIVYAPFDTGPLYRVPADGGERTLATRNEPGTVHQHPDFLPDGRHFLFYSRQGATLSVGSLDTLEARPLPLPRAVFAPPNLLMFISNGALFVREFDTEKLEVKGDSTRIVERVAYVGARENLAASASTVRSVAYRSGAGSPRQFVWLDRSGREIGIFGTSPVQGGNARFSPDGQTLVMNRVNSVWLVHANDGRSELFRSALSVFPVWAPDGNRIAFGVAGGFGTFDLFQKSVGSDSETPLLESLEIKYPSDWSRTGFLLYERLNSNTSWDLLALPPDSNESITIAQTAAQERFGRFSPDGNWIAYQSDESGGNEVYVQPFPGTSSARRQVSLRGGTSPRWSPDGTELYFLSSDNHLMVAAITHSTEGRMTDIARPTPLFPEPLRAGSDFEVSPKGDRFLVNAPVQDTQSIFVLSNWMGGRR